MRVRPLPALTFLALVFLPRLIANDPYVQFDEPRWIIRADDYATAFHDRNWQRLYSPGYPAIPNLITMAPVVAAYRQTARQPPGSPEGWDLQNRQRVLRWARGSVGLGTALIGLLLFRALRRTRLVAGGGVLAGVLTLVVLNEPWVLGMSRTVMMDAYVSLFLLLSLAAAVAARESGKTRWVVGSGVAWALAFLSKTPALFFPPLILLPLVAFPARATIRRFFLWSVAALATVFVLWPAFALDPVGEARDLLFWGREQTTRFHEPHYWPGWHPPFLFVALSLPLFVGLLWYLWSRFRELRRGAHQPGIFFADLALLGGLLFQLIMEAFVADRSRWILPGIVFLAVPGAVGAFRLARVSGLRPVAAALALVVTHGAYTAVWFPYSTLHLNPLFRTEAATWQFGMGEGYREAARYFDGLPGNLLVATKAPGSLQPYLRDPERVKLTRFPKSGNFAELPAETTHIVLPYGLRNRLVAPLEREAVTRIFAWMEGRTPVHRIVLRGVPLHGIYRVEE